MEEAFPNGPPLRIILPDRQQEPFFQRGVYFGDENVLALEVAVDGARSHTGALRDHGHPQDAGSTLATLPGPAGAGDDRFPFARLALGRVYDAYSCSRSAALGENAG